MAITKRSAMRSSRWNTQLGPDSRPSPLTINDEAAKLLGISRGIVYALARRSEFTRLPEAGTAVLGQLEGVGPTLGWGVGMRIG